MFCMFQRCYDVARCFAPFRDVMTLQNVLHVSQHCQQMTIWIHVNISGGGWRGGGGMNFQLSRVTFNTLLISRSELSQVTFNTLLMLHSELSKETFDTFLIWCYALNFLILEEHWRNILQRNWRPRILAMETWIKRFESIFAVFLWRCRVAKDVRLKQLGTLATPCKWKTSPQMVNGLIHGDPNKHFDHCKIIKTIQKSCT